MKKLLSIVSLILSIAITSLTSTPQYNEQEKLLQAVSSTTDDEKELQQLLATVRQEYVTLLEKWGCPQLNCSLLQLKLAIHHPLYAADEIKSKNAQRIARIATLDRQLTKQYDSEAESIKEALYNGASVNATDSQGRTPLFLAVLNNKPSQIISLLLAAGADIFAQDPQTHQTPEDLADYYCRIDRKLDFSLPPGKTVPGILSRLRAEDRERSCWTLDALKNERRKRTLGGIGALYHWLAGFGSIIAPKLEDVRPTLEAWETP
jgi:type I site-specific restriction endonuclease